MKILHNPHEIIAIVDDNDNVIGKEAREIIHRKGLQHREVFIYLINSKKQILLHKRKDVHLWDSSSSGHFPVNQEYTEAAIREFEEELGIKLAKKDMKMIAKDKITTSVHNIINNKFAAVFVVNKDISIEKFKIDEDEIEEIKYFNINELKNLLKTENITKSSKILILKYIIQLIDSL